MSDRIQPGKKYMFASKYQEYDPDASSTLCLNENCQETKDKKHSILFFINSYVRLKKRIASD